MVSMLIYCAKDSGFESHQHRFFLFYSLCPVFIEYKYKVNFTLFGRGFQVACVVRPLWYGAAMIVGWWDRLPSPAVMY